MQKPYYMLCITLLIFMTACGSNQHASSDTGSISFKLQLSRPTTTSRAAAAAPADICTDYGITTINANVVTSSGAAVAAGNWSCSAHEGTVTNVPAGTDYTIIITGTATGGAIAWRGEKSGVGVTVGETTPAGTITVAYLGSDATPPVVTSSTPAIDATGVPVTTMITAIFSEKIATSSVNTTTVTLKQGVTPVSGSVVYDAGTTIAIFIPSNNLSYSTTYTATLTTDIEDMAGNNMASGYSWSFTTEDLPSALPSAPTGVTATAGSGQITINWNAVSGATSYNVYWSTTPSITKAIGTKIQNVTSPYPHKGLSNGAAYYYVVTAANSYGESSESSEVNATPGSIDSTPPTGSITINSNALYTTSMSATLTLSASDQSGTSQMCISNTTSCSSWEAYTTSKSWTLPTGDGTRLVYAWFKDSVGNSNPSPYIASIIIDTTLPIDGTLTATAGDGQVSLNWSGFSDATSGIGSYRLVYSTSGTPDSCSSGTQIYSGSETSYIHTGLINIQTYYYRLCVVDNAGNISEGISTSKKLNFSAITVDSVGDIGSQNDIAIDSNNNVHISYRDDTNRDLKYTTNATGSWAIYTIDNIGDGGSYPSIAIDSNNKVHISYFDWDNWDLKYATNATGSWAIYTIDSAGGVGLSPSIAIDSNNKVHISYNDYDNNIGVNNLKYATNASGSWVTSTIFSRATESSIAIDSNNKVYISYFDWTDWNLKLVTNASGLWVTSSIDYEGRVNSITIDSDNKVHISYYDEININLKYATNASGTWIITTIERVENMGNTTSIAIDSNDKVYISYSTNGYLKYATNTSGSWVSSIIDSPGYLCSSIAVDSNNKVHISYYDNANDDLKYVTNQ